MMLPPTLALSMALSTTVAMGPTFTVTLDPSAGPAAPISGRLVVFVIKSDAHLAKGAEPKDGPFWDDPQPLFGVDVRGLASGASASVNDSADGFPVKPSALPAGVYKAQAVLITNHDSSEWKDSAGNFYSDISAFIIPPADGRATAGVPVALKLTHRTSAANLEPAAAGVEWFSLRSAKLSAFRGSDVVMHAGVVMPLNYDPTRRYAAIYEVPGFGGRHTGAAHVAAERARMGPGAIATTLAANTFYVVLDPESPNGHTLFADSANNGPCAAALISELIPALEAKFPLVAKPEGRLLRGHSSGGWSTLWLALNYPDTFGATWSSSPDPVDFRCFETVNIYAAPNMFTGGGHTDLSSYRAAGASRMSIRQESSGEDILGPDNTSGRQWDSWFAVFGPRNAQGHPAALFDPHTGVIDPAIAQAYKAYDIGERLRRHPATYAPIFHKHVHLVVGGDDNYYLNEAVALLQADLAKAQPAAEPGAGGYVKIVPGKDHGSIYQTPEIAGFPQEMLDHLRRNGLVAESSTATAPAKTP